MLVIREKQIESLFSQRLEKSIASYEAYFRAIVPEFTRDLDEESLHGRLHAGIADARVYGVEAAPALTMYLLLSVVLGPAFCKQSNVDRFLRLSGLEPVTKLEMLIAELARRIQAEGHGRGDPDPDPSGRERQRRD
jgi:hypothetical protein